ncbi:MAG: hypothetical protein MZW92_23895 [Comamonadaceae bacterium]|nr:hypothetical protein [Comamonadaceae bacterium]
MRFMRPAVQAAGRAALRADLRQSRRLPCRDPAPCDRASSPACAPPARMHLGHYHGALKNWVRLQDEHDCFYFVADWHALTTHYEEREVIGAQRLRHGRSTGSPPASTPSKCTIFIQSRLPEHAELFTLLAMGTPLGWLERVPTYKDQIEKLKDRDLATYGFLGYPLLQAADILIYKATYVPVGEDQSSHVELTREVARRFNHLYGRAAGLRRAGGRGAGQAGARTTQRYFEKQRKAFGETGAPRRWPRARRWSRKAAASVAGWSDDDSELLLGHLKGSGKTILAEPQALHTEVPRLPGPGRREDEQELRQRDR